MTADSADPGLVVAVDIGTTGGSGRGDAGRNEGGNLDAIDAYSPRALDRIWKSENFSYWMTQMLHTPAEAVSFDLKRQIGELNAVASSKAGQTYLAESYTGWPDQKLA